MSKGDGLKIGIKFTEDLVGVIAPPIITYDTQKGAWTASGSYSSSDVNNAKDGSESTYWQSRSTSNYIQIVNPDTKLLGFKIYKGSSYRPSTYKVSTSEDGLIYSDIETGSVVAATGWETITFENPITSGYFRFNFGYSSRLYLYELVLIVEGYDNLQVNDFVITGKEYKYVNGELIDKRYEVVNYEHHPTEEKSILITLDWWGRFNNVEGDITIAYDAIKGSLTGAGGAVESFEVQFTPEDLIQTPNPNEEELIKAYPYEIVLDLKEVTYSNGYPQETIKAYPYEIVLELKHVDEINP
jgi:hypothetical protein